MAKLIFQMEGNAITSAALVSDQGEVTLITPREALRGLGFEIGNIETGYEFNRAAIGQYGFEVVELDESE